MTASISPFGDGRPATLLTTFLVATLLLPSAIIAQAEAITDAELHTCLRAEENLLVEVDSNGFADWRMTNPRNPFPVVKVEDCSAEKEQGAAQRQTDIRSNKVYSAAWDQVAGDARVTLVNTAPDRAAVVKIVYEHELPDPDDALALSAERLRSARRIADDVRGSRDLCEGPPTSECLDGLFAHTETFHTEVASLLLSIQRYRDERARALGSSETVIAAIRPNLLHRGKDYERTAGELRRGLRALLDEFHQVITFLDGEVKKATSQADAQAASSLRDSLVRLEATLPALADALDVEEEPEPPIAECPSLLATRQTCAWTTVLFEKGEVKLEGELWERLIRFSKGVLEIKVEFFDERNVVSNPSAYLRVKSKVEEPGNSTSWKLSGTIGGSVQPEVDRDLDDGFPGFFSADEPYADGRRRSFNGLAKLELTQRLGTLALGRVVGQFKGGDLGEAEATRDFVVPEYEVRVFGRQGISLLFGKKAFASPASAIAINEKGEGFRLDYRTLSLTHIVKRESLTGIADDDDEDSDVWLLSTRFRPPKQGIIQFTQVTALQGESSMKDQTPYTYRTVGFETNSGSLFGDKWSLTGRAAYFYSERKADTAAEPPPCGEEGAEDDAACAGPGFLRIADGSGGVWLLDASITQLGPITAGSAPKSLRSWSLVLAGGDGDDPRTQDEDEGYVGETNGFAPDALFLSGLAGALRDPLQTLTDPGDGGEPTLRLGTALVRPGLSNKRYHGLQFVEREHAWFSPLHFLAWAVGSRADVVDEAIVLSLHVYRLDEPLFGSRDAGREIDLKFEIQAPKGVKTSLSIGHYSPGRATDPFFDDDAFVVSSAVSLSL